MRRHLQQSGGQLVALLATAVYLLTMDRSASWWDCGEFIATGWGLQVGHPPGAPFYQLLQHLMMLLSFGNTSLVAPLSNALSAIAGGVTVGLLYQSIVELGARRRGALVGALCYLFCDTVWFSAVESEVYALAMFFCALDTYLLLRWRRTNDARLLPLTGLMLGLGVCVHLMTLLVVPALALIYFCKKREIGWIRRDAMTLTFAALFFIVGLTPYLIVPIRAAANPPINEMKGDFGTYIKREQYAKAPLYPRMWRQRDAENWREWTIEGDGIAANTIYYFNYQLNYMYGRYLMYNLIGRENGRWGCVVVFVLPALLCAYGLWRHRRRDRLGWWVVMALFLMGGVILNFYLNHPCYEPRSRDYVYVLSIYAAALWIGIGADEIDRKLSSHRPRLALLLLLAPLTLAVGNWADHDRSHCHSVHDISLNHLQSCDHGAVLITLGDNDTFPLWYLQQVEHRRTDIEIYNVGLTGWSQTLDIINNSIEERPVYVSQYFYDKYANLFSGRLRCEGFCWRLLPNNEGVDDPEPLQRHMRDSIEWNITKHEYIDRISKNFLRDWERNTGCPVR